jgi:protein TonB
MRIITSLILWAAVVAAPLYGQDPPKKVSSQAVLSAASTKVQPEYPEMAKKMGIQGNVELEAVVDEAGSVEKVETVSGNPILARAGVDALKRWKFKPFIEDGKPVKVTAPVSFTFKR